MHKKYHEKFKILDILAVTTQAHKGIETADIHTEQDRRPVTTQAHKGIETLGRYCIGMCVYGNNSSP